KIIRGKHFNEPVVLWGDGHQRREVVHIDDFIGALLRLADTVDNDLVNIGAGYELSIRTFAQTICERVGYDFARIQFDESRYVGARSKCLSTAKLRRLLPDFPMRRFEEGIGPVLEWVAANEGVHL